MTNYTEKVYAIINGKAGSNIAMQGLSGLLGFPYTLLADAGVVFTHYGPMLNQIRALYGRNPLSRDVIMPIIKGCTGELLADLVLDKIVGQIPLIGIASNMICARAMTWRLGILFAVLSARGEEVNDESVGRATRMIRELFPQNKTLTFQKPSMEVLDKLLNAMQGQTVQGFNEKVSRILDML